MNTLTTWGLIGHGNIGKEIERQIGQPDVARRLGLKQKPEFIVDSGGIHEGDKLTPGTFLDVKILPDVVFIAIPSSDSGQVAYDYISTILSAGKIVITAEKGALANYYGELKVASDDFARLGITATVGGGTRILHVAKEYCLDIDNITQIHLALNGTLAAIMSWVSPISGVGLALPEAAEKAVALGYAEPGSDSAEQIIRAEAEGDIPKKLSIFCNVLGLSNKLVDWSEFRFMLSEQQVTEAVSSEVPRRFIVSLYPLASYDHKETDVVGGFNFTRDNWQFVGGFRKVDANPLFGPLTALTGPGNGMVIGLGPNAADGVYAVTGPGAGVGPTVNAMIDDYLRLAGAVKS